ncbi:hypothetical protein F5Y05DRAFT_226894 [Hypoxylon sp. FL0543]|nr:hypothetical protein F5Y05DRAFT_226894 [Hypoxylon sp. FL0543]
MAPITEVAIIPLKPEADAATIDAALEANVATLLAQPGCQRVRTSRVHEDPSKLRIFADWDSAESQRAFAADPAARAPFLQRMAAIVDPGAGPRRPPYHVELEPFPPAALNGTRGSGGTAKGPVSELLTAYFPADVGEAARAAATRTVREFLAKMAGFAAGITGETAVGWSAEADIEHKGEPCRVLLAVIGWASVEAHMKARETPQFEEIIPMVRGLEGLRGLEMVHVTNTTVERS